MAWSMASSIFFLSSCLHHCAATCPRFQVDAP
uniref:Uncharacterized protein n=1 Tax=Arundo donax TaxID=35708 RepID=A0A0A9A959_ARUDO